MPNDPGTALTATQQFNRQLDEQVNNFRALLPSHIPVEKFKRVVVVAISQNPALFKCERRSLFTAAQKCAADGLLPDGRQAAFIVYGDKVEYQPMIAGIRQRMRNSGEVLSAEAHVVYRNDKFFQKLGDDAAIVHEPPALGVDRGDLVGAYAIIKLKNGEVLREVVDKPTIDRARAVSKSPTGPAWTKWYDEMARKFVLRRCAKFAPTSADIDTLLARDDESSDAGMLDITPPEPEPPRGHAITHEPAPPAPTYTVIDCDGEEYEFKSADLASRLLADVFADAERRGSSHVAAARENNADLIAEIGEPQSHSPAGKPQGNTAPKPSISGKALPDTGLLHADQGHNSPAGEDAYRVELPDNPTSDDVATFEAAISALIESGAPRDVIRNNNAFNLARFEKLEPLRHNALLRKLESK